MKLIAAGLFLILCAHAAAPPKSSTNLSLLGNGFLAVDSLCIHVAGWSGGMEILTGINRPQKEHISFQLRTRGRITEYPVEEASKLRNSPEFDVKKKTVVYVSGWLTTMFDPLTAQISNAYLCRGDSNLIVVNTHTYLRLEYIASASNTDKIGEFIALGLKNLDLLAKNYHLIGHSLGAEVVGSAGSYYQKLTGHKIARLTALDPARPCFSEPMVFRRLSKTDAEFVDTIHTNSGEAGLETAIGDADFYVNGLNPTQTGCYTSRICSHFRSVLYMTESVYVGNEQNFIGTRCDDYNQLALGTCMGAKATMGYAASKKNRGIYRVDVNPTPPYGKNAMGLGANKCQDSSN